MRGAALTTLLSGAATATPNLTIRRVSKPYTQQPPLGVVPLIDWSNPLSRGLITAVLPFSMGCIELLGRGAWNRTSVQSYWVPAIGRSFGSWRGPTYGGSGSSYAFNDTNATLAATASSLSVYACVKAPRPLSDTVLVHGLLGTSVANIRIGFRTGLWMVESDFSQGMTTVSGSAYSSEEEASVAGVLDRRDNTLSLYKGKVKANSVDVTGKTLQSVTTGTSGYLDSYSSIAVGYGWARPLSAAEIALLDNNPFQLFLHRSGREFIFDPVASGLYPSLSLAQLINLTQTQATPRVTITVP